MAKKRKGIKPYDTLFDFLRREAADALSNDVFSGTGEVFVRVLKTFEVNLGLKEPSWIDAVMPQARAGQKELLQGFKGRVFTNSYDQYLTIHSSIPDPDEYQGKSSDPESMKRHQQYIDMHPTFYVMKNSPGQQLIPGDICRCTFPHPYPDAGGDSYGFFIDRVSNVRSTNIRFKQEEYSRAPFEITEQIFDPPPETPEFVNLLPMNIFLIGDNMFGVSPTKLGIDSTFAKELTIKLKNVYRDLDNLALAKTNPAALAKKHNLDEDLVKKVADEIQSVGGGKPVRIPFYNLSISNFGLGSIDPTYFTDEHEEFYKGKAGKIHVYDQSFAYSIIPPTLEEAVANGITTEIETGTQLLDQVKGIMEKRIESTEKFWENSGQDPLQQKKMRDVGLATLEQPPYAIVGFEGASSAIPGWAGLLPDSAEPALGVMAHYAWGGEDPLFAKQRNYETLQSYAELAAQEEPHLYVKAREDQIKAMMDKLKDAGFTQVQLVGPPVITQAGYSQINTLSNAETKAKKEDFPGTYSFSYRRKSSNKKSRLISEAMFHPKYSYNMMYCEAMRKVAKKHPLKPFMVLPYCSRYENFDGKPEQKLVPKPTSKGMKDKDTRKRMASWIINNILAQAIGTTNDQQKPGCSWYFTEYGDGGGSLSKDKRINDSYDSDDVEWSARVQHSLRVQKMLLKEVERIYKQADAKKDGDAAQITKFETISWTDQKLKDINSYLESSVNGFSKKP